MSNNKARYHALTRTSPQGQPFIGRCMLCGLENLAPDALRQHCDNPAGTSEDDALIQAVERDEAERQEVERSKRVFVPLETPITANPKAKAAQALAEWMFGTGKWITREQFDEYIRTLFLTDQLCDDEGCEHHGTPHICRSTRVEHDPPMASPVPPMPDGYVPLEDGPEALEAAMNETYEVKTHVTSYFKDQDAYNAAAEARETELQQYKKMALQHNARKCADEIDHVILNGGDWLRRDALLKKAAKLLRVFTE